MESSSVERCDLLIIGAGYAGVNALNSAAYHLPEGARVVVAAKERTWGGQWVDQYDFVRLHQPYKSFTAGTREWDLKKPPSHLATKKEILRHFEQIAQQNMCEKRLDLVTLFEHECSELAAMTDEHGEKKVQVLARPLRDEANLPTMTFVADRVIKALGADISIKAPLTFSTTRRIHSLSPVDVLTSEWNLKMRFSEDKHKPIFVIGSGKTAMDVMYQLHKQLDSDSRRLHCIAGRGTWFFNRDEFNHTDFWKRNMYGNNTVLDWFIECFGMYDGTNAKSVCKEMGKRGFMHSPIPDAESFVAGVCSEEEVSTVRTALSPGHDKIIKGHLIDIVDGEVTCQLKLRALDGTTYMQKIPEGSFVVNCTDHISEQRNTYEPILAMGGLVLNTQFGCGFTGPSANYLTHLFYLNKLDGIWQSLPRIELDLNDKAKFGLELFMLVVIGSGFVTSRLPADVKKRYVLPPGAAPPWHRMIPALFRMRKALPMLKGKVKNIEKRYSDDKIPFKGLQSVLGGNAGVTASL